MRRFLVWSGLFLLLCLLAAWWSLQQSGRQPAPTPRVSILQQAIPELADSGSASQEEVLSLADVELADLLQRFPQAPAAINAKANRDFLLNDMQTAEQGWRSTLAIDPRNPDALFGLANLAFQAGKYQEAIGICDGLQLTNPGNPRVPLLLADAFMNSGQADLAVLTLEQHILTEPTSVQAFEMLGTAQLTLGNSAKAIDCFNRVLEFSPDSKDAYYGLGQAYVRLGERDKATAAMQRFSELASASSQSNASEAQAFEDRDQAAHVAAQTYLDSALVHKSAGDLPAAQSRILKALRLQPDVIAWLEELQIVLQRKGLHAEAADVGQRLVELAPDDVKHWLALGSTYATLQQPEPAIAAFRKAIELAPEHPECQAAAAVIEQLN